jgi:hypothetical protein
MIIAFSLVMLLLSCEESQVDFEARCIPILQNILNIQDMREVIRKDFSITTSLYKRHKIHEDLWQKEKIYWLKREKSLGQEVTKLYDYAYSFGCLK